jgi:hypothetical protein
VSTLLIAVTIFGYLAGYVLSAAAVVRRQGWDVARCHGIMGYAEGQCRRFDSDRCWRPGPTITQAVNALLAPLAWPLLALPVLAWWLGTRKPSPEALAQRIAQLEAELGVGGRS